MKDIIAQAVRYVSTKPKDETMTRKGFIHEIGAMAEFLEHPMEIQK